MVRRVRRGRGRKVEGFIGRDFEAEKLEGEIALQYRSRFVNITNT